MDVPVQLWEAWRAQVKHLFPSLHGHQQKTLAWMVLGIVLSGSAVLQRMAEGLHGIGPATMPSIERRLARFVANERIQASRVWKAFLSQVLPAWQQRQVSLVLDCPLTTGRPFCIWGCWCIPGCCHWLGRCCLPALPHSFHDKSV